MKTKSAHPVCRWVVPQWKPITLTAALSLLMALSTALAGGRNANPGVIPPQTHPYGQSYGEWGSEWWEWALSTPEANNPVLDLTGVDANVNQAGPVFFLAGTFGGDPVVRNVTIESGKALFIPILNWNQTYPEDAPGVPRNKAEAAMRNTLNAFFDTVDPNDLHCEVDGIALRNLSTYRAQSPVYSMSLAPDSSSVTMWGYAAGEHDLNVSDGYWVMLAPLSVGNHTIRVRWATYLDVTYHLTVQAGAHLCGRLAADGWQWVLGIPADSNPLLDQTGANAAVGQCGPVWFLAGTTGGSAERAITVPAGKSLFFPLVNNVWIGTPGDPPWRRPYTDTTTGEKYRSFEQYVRMAPPIPPRCPARLTVSPRSACAASRRRSTSSFPTTTFSVSIAAFTGRAPMTAFTCCCPRCPQVTTLSTSRQPNRTAPGHWM